MSTFNVSTTFAGTPAAGYISAALLSGKTLDNGYLTIKDGIKYREVIQRYEASNIIHDASCDWSDAGTVALTERYLDPKEFQVNLSLCKKTLKSSWESMQMGLSAYDGMPTSFSDYVIADASARVGAQIEQNIYSGSTEDGKFLGFENLFLQAGAGVVSASLGGALTGSSTVIAGLTTAFNSVADTIYGTEDLEILAGPAVVRAYQAALSGQGNGFLNQGYAYEKPMDFLGLPIKLAPGMKASQGVIIARKSNLYFGTSLIDDIRNTVKVIDMENIDGSQNVRFLMRYTATVNYGIGSEIVWAK